MTGKKTTNLSGDSVPGLLKSLELLKLQIPSQNLFYCHTDFGWGPDADSGDWTFFTTKSSPTNAAHQDQQESRRKTLIAGDIFSGSW